MQHIIISIDCAEGTKHFFIWSFILKQRNCRNTRERLRKSESMSVWVWMWKNDHVCIFMNLLWAMPSWVSSYSLRLPARLPAGVTALISCYSSAQPPTNRTSNRCSSRCRPRETVCRVRSPRSIRIHSVHEHWVKKINIKKKLIWIRSGSGFSTFYFNYRENTANAA